MAKHESSPVWGMYVEQRNRAEKAEREKAALLEALKEMVDYSQCRQDNASERKMLAEQMARLGKKYRPLLASLGASPFVEDFVGEGRA